MSNKTNYTQSRIAKFGEVAVCVGLNRWKTKKTELSGTKDPGNPCEPGIPGPPRSRFSSITFEARLPSNEQAGNFKYWNLITFHKRLIIINMAAVR